MQESLHQHRRSDEFWVNEHQRYCVGPCHEVKDLVEFRPWNAKKTDPLRLITDMCMDCRQKQVKAIRKQEENKDLIESNYAAGQAMMKLAEAVASGTRRKVLKDACPDPSVLCSEIIKTTGGIEYTGQLIGTVLKDVMESPSVKPLIRVQAAKALMDFMISAKRLEGEPIDVSDLSQADMHEMCMEPARQLLLTDETFRKEILALGDVKTLVQDAEVPHD